jgi:hypothetical protein
MLTPIPHGILLAVMLNAFNMSADERPKFKICPRARGIYCMIVNEFCWLNFLNVTVCVSERLKV